MRWIHKVRESCGGLRGLREGRARPSQPCEGSIRARGVRSLVKHQEAAAVCVDARELRPGVRNRHPPAVQQGQRLAKLVEVQPAVVGEVHLIEEEEQLDVCPNRQAGMSAWWGGEGRGHIRGQDQSTGTAVLDAAVGRE